MIGCQGSPSGKDGAWAAKQLFLRRDCMRSGIENQPFLDRHPDRNAHEKSRGQKVNLGIVLNVGRVLIGGSNGERLHFS
jgi:hypothetical protein